MNLIDLIDLYQKMADHTAPECHACNKGELHCCERQYCEKVRIWAKEEHGITLVDTGHPVLPFMGHTGCVVAPYLRPICALHTCDIHQHGYKPGDMAWTTEYYRLFSLIDVVQQELEKQKKNLQK